MDLAWYARRLARMTPGEILWRVRDTAVQRRWRGRQIHCTGDDQLVVPSGVRASLPPLDARDVDPAARAALLATADQILAGRWKVFADERDDMMPAPDWFADPRTGSSAPRSTYCFRIDHRDEGAVGNVKYVWELSRHTHCTVVAAAYHLTGHERYAHAVAGQLRSWWQENPFLSGIHWTSGIEVGLRLIAWAWIRRLVAAWDGAVALFDENPLFLRQLHHHQEYLATFESRGSSANNHLIAEAAGQFTAACAFPFFAESDRWRRDACAVLQREVPRQVFPDGLHRELASEYHGFVLELALLAAVEGEAQGHPLGAGVWQALCRMTDALAAIVDARIRPPRQGDGDQGHGVLVDAPGYDRWSSLLSTGEQLFGRLPWWPEVACGDVRTGLLEQLAKPQAVVDRPAVRPSLFADAGQVLLRDHAGSEPELWCRFDAGPHGYPGIAAHAHADALSLEVREAGVEVLADPGTYAYHGDVPWRTYFRSTLGHNTLELSGTDQSTMGGGPFLWTRWVDGELLETGGLDSGNEAHCTARHAGYRQLHPPATHVRAVTLDRERRRITIRDRVDVTGEGERQRAGGRGSQGEGERQRAGGHPCRLAYHLGPDVTCELRDGAAMLRWEADGRPRSARMELPAALTWSAHRGETDPIAGWYSPDLYRKVPATTLVGAGEIGGDTEFVTTLQFLGRRSRSTVCLAETGSAKFDGGDLRARADATARRVEGRS